MTGYTMYIDGACPNNGSDQARAGWGAFITNPQGDTLELAAPVPWDQPQTNNRAELLAFLEALARCNRPGPITAISDSQLLVKGATEWMPGWKSRGWRKTDKTQVEHQDLWERIDAAMQAREIRFVWVKARSGNPGNDKADALARLGASGKRISQYVRGPGEVVPA